MHVFAARGLGPLDEGARPDGTRERRWLGPDELATVALRDEDLRAMLRAALA